MDVTQRTSAAVAALAPDTGPAPERNTSLDTDFSNVVGLDSARIGDGSGDGRTLRRSRNRQAVIVSLLALIREGELEPSVAAIADKAGVSHRSVFRYFDDLNDLVRTAIDHEVRTALPLAVIDDMDGAPLDERVAALVDVRLRVFAVTHQVGRVARLRAHSIPAIDESLAMIADFHRTQIRRQFDAELANHDTGRVEALLDSALVLTSFESYDMHRRSFMHDPERIRAVWINALVALFSN